MNKAELRKEMARSLIKSIGTTQAKQDILLGCSIKDRMSKNQYKALLSYHGQAFLWVWVDNVNDPQSPFKVNIIQDIA